MMGKAMAHSIQNNVANANGSGECAILETDVSRNYCIFNPALQRLCRSWETIEESRCIVGNNPRNKTIKIILQVMTQ